MVETFEKLMQMKSKEIYTCRDDYMDIGSTLQLYWAVGSKLKTICRKSIVPYDKEVGLITEGHSLENQDIFYDSEMYQYIFGYFMDKEDFTVSVSSNYVYNDDDSKYDEYENIMEDAEMLLSCMFDNLPEDVLEMMSTDPDASALGYATNCLEVESSIVILTSKRLGTILNAVRKGKVSKQEEPIAKVIDLVSYFIQCFNGGEMAYGEGMENAAITFFAEPYNGYYCTELSPSLLLMGPMLDSYLDKAIAYLKGKDILS